MHKESVSHDSYEEMAEYYFRDIDNKPYNAHYERPATLSLLPGVEGKSVVDAGCAAGWYTEQLLRMGAKVTAVDFSSRMIEMTHRRVGGKARLVQADLNEPLAFLADASQDVVLSSLALHYLKDWTSVLSEFYRALKPEGVLVFSVHHPFMDFTHFQKENYFLTELLDDEWNTPDGKVKIQFYRRPLYQIIAAIHRAGFVLEELLEPMPADAFRQQAPLAYDKLTRTPQFLFIRARKPQL
ncbi:Malonyl-[acyl-carrier protein] O-methyltransferase [compost metagenome]